MHKKIRKAKDRGLLLISALFALFGVVMLIAILLTVFTSALPSLTPYFLFTPESATPGLGQGIANAVVGSILLSLISTVLATPFALGTAIYLQKYAPDNRFTRTLRFFIEVLSGTPSIVVGAFGLLVLVIYLRPYTGGFSLIAGSIGLAILILPVIERAVEDAIATVPNELEEGSYALGATKWQTIRDITIPTVISGITTGTILGFGRAAEESAVVILTAGYTQFLPEIGIKQSDKLFMGMKVYPFQDLVASLPYAVYHAYENSNVIPMSNGFACAFILIVFVMMVNIVAKIGFYFASNNAANRKPLLRSLRTALSNPIGGFRRPLKVPCPVPDQAPPASRYRPSRSSLAAMTTTATMPQQTGNIAPGITTNAPATHAYQPGTAHDAPTDWLAALSQPIVPARPLGIESVDSHSTDNPVQESESPVITMTETDSSITPIPRIPSDGLPEDCVHHIISVRSQEESGKPHYLIPGFDPDSIHDVLDLTDPVGVHPEFRNAASREEVAALICLIKANEKAFPTRGELAEEPVAATPGEAAELVRLAEHCARRSVGNPGHTLSGNYPGRTISGNSPGSISGNSPGAEFPPDEEGPDSAPGPGLTGRNGMTGRIGGGCPCRTGPIDALPGQDEEGMAGPAGEHGCPGPGYQDCPSADPEDRNSNPLGPMENIPEGDADGRACPIMPGHPDQGLPEYPRVEQEEQPSGNGRCPCCGRTLMEKLPEQENWRSMWRNRIENTQVDWNGWLHEFR